MGQRPPIDDTKFAAQKDFLAFQLAADASAALFAEWLKLRRAEARVTAPSRG